MLYFVLRQSEKALLVTPHLWHRIKITLNGHDCMTHFFCRSKTNFIKNIEPRTNKYKESMAKPKRYPAKFQAATDLFGFLKHYCCFTG